MTTALKYDYAESEKTLPIFTFNPATGTICIDGDLFTAKGGKIIVKLSDATFQSDSMNFISNNNLQFKAACHGSEMLLTINNDNTLSILIKNISSRKFRVEEIDIEFPPTTFSPALQARKFRHLVHPMDFATPCGVKAVHLPAEGSQVDPESSMVTVFSNVETANAFLLGVLPPFGTGFGSITTIHDHLHMEGNFGVRIRFRFHQSLDPGSELQTSPLAFLDGIDGTKLLEKYAYRIRSRLNRPAKPQAIGWNSWDYYAGAVSRKDMDENISALKKIFADRIKYIVIDEGWECMWGVWQENWKFPQGLEDFCRHVKHSGYVPGIWTAPFLVNYYTPLYRNHPEWFVGCANGNVALTTLSYGTMAQLDITNKGVQDHLRKIYTHLRKCGFEYFKVDFTQLILQAEQFHDERISKAQIIRMVFQLIRECIGDDCYLLSCGAPFESVIGIADACRTSGDIHNYWGMAVQNIHCMFTRWWMQGSIGNTDPDFLIVRTPETTDDKQLNRRLPILPRTKGTNWINGIEMNLEEAKVLALAIHMTGGDVILGDAIGKLNEMGIDVLEKILSPLKAPATPINLFEPHGQDCPILLAEKENEFVIGIFNLTDEPVTQTVDHKVLRESSPIKAVDFWTGQKIKITIPFQLTLPPRSAKGLKILRNHPQSL